MRTELAKIIRKNFDRINQQWTTAILHSAGSHYRNANRERVLESNRQCLEAFLAYIQTGDSQQIHEWNRRVTFERVAGAFGGKPGFGIDEMQLNFYLFRDAVLEVLDEDNVTVQPDFTGRGRRPSRLLS